METKIRNMLFVTGNSLAVIFTIIINALAIILPINGITTQELSDQIPNLFVPAGITFSIWSIIYILLIFFMFYQINEVFIKKIDPEYLDRIGVYFILASFANIVWVFLWHYKQVNLSIFAMIILFLSLLIIYQRLNIGKIKTSFKEKMLIHLPMSVYIGWITVATIANVTAVIVYNRVGDLLLGEMVWAILAIIIATLITILILKNRNDIGYSFVIIWALLGIAIKRFSPEIINGVKIYDVEKEIAYTAIACIIIISVTILIKVFSNRKKLLNYKK